MVSLRDIARELGLKKEKEAGDRTDYFCPVHDSDSGDLSIYHRSHFGCHHTGGESPVTLLMHCKDWSDKDKAVEWMQEHFPDDFGDIDQETIDRKQKAREVLNKARDLAHDTLKKQKTGMLEEIKEGREFDDETVEEVKIGFLSSEDVDTLESRFGEQALVDSGLFVDTEDSVYCHLQNRIVFPYMVDQETYFMIGRRPKGSDMDAKYKKTNTTDYNKHILYEFTTGEADQVIITEGVTDAISAYKAGYDVVSPVTTQFRQKDIDKVVRRVESYDEVYLINDNDEAGEEGARKTAEELTKAGNEPFMVQLEKVDDLDDYTTMNGYDLSVLLDDAERYIDLIANKIEDADRNETAELKEQVYELVQNWSKNQRIPVWETLPGNKREMKKAFKEWKEEHGSTGQENEDVQPSTAIEEDEETVTESLKASGEEIRLNPVTRLTVKELEKEVRNLKKNKEGAVKPEPKFKVYKFAFGDGTEERGYKLVTEPEKSLNPGDKFLAIKQADLSKPEYRKWLKEEYQKMVEDGFEGSFDDYLTAVEGDIYELSGEIGERSRKKIRNLSSEEIKQLVDEYLDYGFEKDPKLKKVMYSKLVKHDKNLVEPKEVMQYSPHGMMFTNTKVGKSYTADSVGERRDDITPAGLVGYVSADDGRKPGVLHEQDEHVFADEINFGSKDQLNDELLTILSMGEAKQSKAGEDLLTRFYGSLTYMANPTEHDENVELVEKFLRLIESLGHNVQAMGSRFGVILFDQEMETVSGTELDTDRGRKLATLVEWMKNEVAPEYSKILDASREWLQQEYPSDYKDFVRSIKSENQYSQKIRQFWEAHLDSYRHARGQALQMAVYRNIGDVLKQEYSHEQILEDAEDCFLEVLDVNMQSISSMAGELEQGEKIRQRNNAMLQGQKPDYLRYFVKTVIARKRQDEEVFEKLEPATALQETWQSLKKKLDSVEPEDRYWNWSKVVTEMKKHRIKKQDKLKDRYGLWMEEEDDILMVKAARPETLNQFVEVECVPNIEGEDISDKKDIEESEKSDDVCEGEEDAHTKQENGEDPMSKMSEMSPDAIKVLQTVQQSNSGINNIGLQQEVDLSEDKAPSKVANELKEEDLLEHTGTVYEITDKGEKELAKAEAETAETDTTGE